MLRRKGARGWSQVTIYPKPWAVALGSPHMGGHLVPLDQNVQCAVATTGCATGMQRCDRSSDHHFARIRHAFPIGFRETGSVGCRPSASGDHERTKIPR